MLVGGGHAHVFVLKSFGMNPMPGVRLTLIAKELAAPYSGMLPGFVAGHYGLEDGLIDLVRLARFAGARIIHGSAVGLDRVNKRVMLDDRPPVRYDLLSLDVGITPLVDDIAAAAEHAITVKPVSVFAPKWQDLERRALQAGGLRRIVVVGGGAAGVELVLAARRKLRTLAPAAGIDPAAFSFSLIAGPVVLPGHNAGARRLALAALREAAVHVVTNDTAVGVTADAVQLASGVLVPADAVLISTKAAAPAWFAATDLPRDAEGFLAARPTLQVRDDDDVFAVGDCASVIEHPRPKSGVFAVRQGPAVAANLRRRVLGEAALPFIPQRQFLSLISLGDKRAIASRGPFAAAGAWAWKLKDKIDRAFIAKFSELPIMTAASDGDSDAMRCGGCAAKVGPVTLAQALDRLRGDDESASQRDDAAIIDDGGDMLRLETVDFFREFWPDPYLLGEIAATHAMSDIFAMGGAPKTAQAIVVVPHARPKIVGEDLFQILAGARAAFDRECVALIGGHSSEGAELSVGFCIGGRVARGRLIPKGGMRPGDQLILTRPIGTGLLFAAQMRGLARAASIDTALMGMRVSQRAAAECLARHGAGALTDVTGFGLAGHLIEMLEASGSDATLQLGHIPLYPQALELAQRGVASTLLPENMAVASHLTSETVIPNADYALLFDPQTCGGLLAGVPAANALACLDNLKNAGVTHAAIIGEVTPPGPGPRRELRLTGAFG